MRKKILTRCAIGFVFGVVMVLLIPAIFNRPADGSARLVSRPLIERFGSPGALAVSILLYGVYGALCMGGTLLYEIESWSIARATLVHYLIVALGYAAAAELLCWNLSAGTLLLIEGLMTLGFFLIWLILYLRGRAQVRELNAIRERMQNENRK